MAAYEPYEQSYKLKSVGAKDWEMEANWFEERPNETTVIRFSNKRPASIRPDDLLLYYASGYEKLFGIVSVFTKPERDEAVARWPWSAEVRPKVIISQLDRAPSLDLLEEADPATNWRRTVQQMDYAKITEDVFDHAAAALVAIAQPSVGDILEERFRTEYATAAAEWKSQHEAR